MSVLVKDLILDSGLTIGASVSYLQRFPSLLHVCEEVKCQLENLMKITTQGRKLLTPPRESLSK